MVEYLDDVDNEGLYRPYIRLNKATAAVLGLGAQLESSLLAWAEVLQEAITNQETLFTPSEWEFLVRVTSSVDLFDGEHPQEIVLEALEEGPPELLDANSDDDIDVESLKQRVAQLTTTDAWALAHTLTLGDCYVLHADRDQAWWTLAYRFYIIREMNDADPEASPEG